MAYTNNPLIPKARRIAVNEVLVKGKNIQEVARKYGIHRSTLYRWIKKGIQDRKSYIYNYSCAPHSHPNQLDERIVNRIIEKRVNLKHRCAEIIKAELKKDNINVSTATIKRIIRKNNLSRKSPLIIIDGTKFPRPNIVDPGDMVQMDTIHYIDKDGSRFFVYAAIDIATRFAFLKYSPRINTTSTVNAAKAMFKKMPFSIRLIQTDNGGEFSQGFHTFLKTQNVLLRKTRVRKPNDNAHVERFIRTVKEECFDRKLPERKYIQNQLSEYIQFYNHSRLHLGIDCLTPYELLSQRC